MLNSEQLDQYWTHDLRENGARLFDIISPDLDRIMREIYVFLLGINPQEVTPDQIQRGFIKFENILRGHFSEEYFETQHKTSKLLIEKGVDFIHYLLCYAIYHREGALCLTRHSLETGKASDAMYHALHLALQCDASVSMSCYFAEMDRANAERTRAMTEKTNARIMEISTSINEFSTQTKMLSINAAIEAARAGTAGKGFAVVASEIKTVATKVQDATGEIEKLARGE